MNEEKNNNEVYDYGFEVKKRNSRIILGIYIIFIIIVVIIIRTSTGTENNTTNNSVENNTNTNEIVNNEINNNVENPEEVNNEFVLMNDKNYEFDINVSFEGTSHTSVGKIYENKIYFDYDDLTIVSGTMNSVKAINKETKEEVQTRLPYAYFNYYDTNVIENIIEHSKLVDGIYQISNKELAELINDNTVSSEEKMNYFTLNKKNGYVTGVVIDISNAASESMNKDTIVVVTIDYKNFGLVEDFNI